MKVAAQSLSLTKLPSPSVSLAFSSYHYKLSVVSYRPTNFLAYDRLSQRLKPKASRLSNFVAIRASDSKIDSTENAERWLLKPVGDGDFKHIGYKVPMPDAFDVASGVVSVGRLPEKADIVIPVATVSALHARIQTRGGNLFVTDLDSTNGTFVGEKRLRPGVVTPVSPGSCIIFGNMHLAMFKVSKVGNAEISGESEVKEPSSNSGNIK